MNQSLSVYFNFIRVLCAALVFIYHAGVVWGGVAERVSIYMGIDGAVAHLAVVVFFVLSGYLIRHALLRPKVTWRKYALDRIARLSSVFLPGLVLTASVMFMIWLTVPERYCVLVPNGFQILRFLANALYLHQSWFWCIVPGFNTPTWSLAYEFWYYVFLGLWCFSPRKWRWVFLALAMLLAGPKILLLLPCWLAGVVARDLKEKLVDRRLIISLFIISFIFSFWLGIYGSNMSLWSRSIGGWPLYYSFNFIFDILFAFFVAVNFWAIAQLGNDFKCPFPEKITRGLEICAGGTFSLYVYHYPLLTAIREFLGGGAVLHFFICILLVVALASITEAKLNWWRDRIAPFFR